MAWTSKMLPRPPDLAEVSSQKTRWFVEEVQQHEPALRAYLRQRFPALKDVDDLVQESYARLFRAYEGGRFLHTKAYLFATARNVAFDLCRRSQVLPFKTGSDGEVLSLVDERPDSAEKVSRDQELELLKHAMATLPGRCREILTLRKIAGLSHREIAMKLGLSENTVNNQLTIGLLRCRDYFRARGALKGDDAR